MLYMDDILIKQNIILLALNFYDLSNLQNQRVVHFMLRLINSKHFHVEVTNGQTVTKE